MSMYVPFVVNTESYVEVLEVFDIITLKLRDYMSSSYICVLGEVKVPLNISQKGYNFVYDRIVERLQGNIFICKKMGSYKIIYLYDKNENIIINIWINNLITYAMMFCHNFLIQNSS